MNHRALLTVFVCLFVASSLACQSSAVEWDQKRPNIIFLMTDDQRDNTLRSMGHAWVKTPHLDKLVTGGVRFRNAYIAEPTCAPSRAAIFTGMHERVNGVGFTSSYQINEAQWERTYPALLRKNGYFTGFIGKFGVEYYTFRGEAAKRFDYWRGHDGWAKFFPKTAKNCQAYYDSDHDIITDVMGESITRFLDQAPADKPFCLSVSFSVPHGSQTGSMHPRQAPANENPKLKDHSIYGSLYRDMPFAIPADTATDPYRYIPKQVMNQNHGRNSTYSYFYDRKTCRETHIRYYQQITGVDKVIGNMMQTLKQKGLDQNTIIIYASDHGLLMGEYGMGGKALLYDLASKIPCFVYDPRQPMRQRGRNVDELVSSLDIPSTILDYAGIDPPTEMQGRSLAPLVAGEEVTWRDSLFLENLYTGRGTPFCEGIRKGKWKYIRMYKGVRRYTEEHVNFTGRKPDFEQLFDLEQDPQEKNNLVGEDECKAILAELRRWCQQKSDALNRRRAEYRKVHPVTER